MVLTMVTTPDVLDEAASGQRCRPAQPHRHPLGREDDNGQTRAVTLHLVPFAGAQEYRIWLPVAGASSASAAGR